MGYHVKIINGGIFIPKDKLQDAYEACVALNDQYDIKCGGRFTMTDSKDGLNPNNLIWFSWMPHDFPDKYKTLKEVVEALGFFTEDGTEGGLHIHGYDSKMGDEEHFLRAIAPYVNSGATLDWAGDDCNWWRYKFDNGSVDIVPLVLTE